MVSTRIIASIDMTSLLFMFLSHLEVISDRYYAAYSADENTDRHKRDEHYRPNVGKRYNLHEGYRQALRDLGLECLIQAPLSEEGKSAAGNAQNQAFDNEGAANKAV